MSKLYIKKDNILKFKDIVVPLFYPGSDEISDNNILGDNKSGSQQTKIYGILVPIVEINNVYIDFQDVLKFNLKSTGVLPEISLSIRDRYNLLSSLATPGADNDMQVCILPPIEDAYKKIKIKFYISSYKQVGEYINITGVYKVPSLFSSRFQSLGKISTYELFNWASNETGLGFVTNVEENNYDSRWIYCNDKSILEILQEQIRISGDSSGRIVFDWWIDLWNNINLCNIYDRWVNKDTIDDMMIWTTGQIGEIDPNVKIEPMRIQALLNNLYVSRNTELYVLDYKIVNNTGSGISKGTDKCYSIWNDKMKEWRDNLIQDSDIKYDIYTKYEYLGENWNDDDFDYILAPYIRDAFLQKLNSQIIEVTLQSPLLGLMRGDQIIFNWYINDSMYKWKKEGLENIGTIEKTITNQIEDIYKENNADCDFVLNNKVSGQYTIIGHTIDYDKDSGWRYNLKLSRPQIDIPDLINEEITKNN